MSMSATQMLQILQQAGIQSGQLNSKITEQSQTGMDAGKIMEDAQSSININDALISKQKTEAALRQQNLNLNYGETLGGVSTRTNGTTLEETLAAKTRSHMEAEVQASDTYYQLKNKGFDGNPLTYFADRIAQSDAKDAYWNEHQQANVTSQALTNMHALEVSGVAAHAAMIDTLTSQTVAAQAQVDAAKGIQQAALIQQNNAGKNIIFLDAIATGNLRQVEIANRQLNVLNDQTRLSMVVSEYKMQAAKFAEDQVERPTRLKILEDQLANTQLNTEMRKEALLERQQLEQVQLDAGNMMAKGFADMGKPDLAERISVAAKNPKTLTMLLSKMPKEIAELAATAGTTKDALGFPVLGENMGEAARSWSYLGAPTSLAPAGLKNYEYMQNKINELRLENDKKSKNPTSGVIPYAKDKTGNTLWNDVSASAQADMNKWVDNAETPGSLYKAPPIGEVLGYNVPSVKGGIPFPDTKAGKILHTYAATADPDSSHDHIKSLMLAAVANKELTLNEAAQGITDFFVAGVTMNRANGSYGLFGMKAPTSYNVLTTMPIGFGKDEALPELAIATASSWINPKLVNTKKISIDATKLELNTLDLLNEQSRLHKLFPSE